MEAFNLNNISVKKVKNSKTKSKSKEEELPVEKALTGEFVKELPDFAKDQANSELEKDEFIQYPNGSIEKVVGDTHEKGGVQLNLPEGSRILSDNLKLGATTAKKLNKEYELDLKAKDTYAEAIDKFNKKSGMTKLTKEQEDLIKVLKKEQDTNDDTTRNLNFSYLNEKIRDVELQKESINKDRNIFFDDVYKSQEKSKGNKVQESEKEFKYGGLVGSDKFKMLAEKYGMSEEEGLKILKNGGSIDRYEDGGEIKKAQEALKAEKISIQEFNTIYSKVKAGEPFENVFKDLLAIRRKTQFEKDLKQVEADNIKEEFESLGLIPNLFETSSSNGFEEEKRKLELEAQQGFRVVPENLSPIPTSTPIPTPTPTATEKKDIKETVNKITSKYFADNPLRTDAPGKQSQSGEGSFGGVNTARAYAEYQQLIPGLADLYRDDAGAFQEAYNEAGKLFVDFLGKQDIPKEDIEQIQKDFQQVNFTDDLKASGRGKDSKRGLFTSSRLGFQYEMFTPEKQKALDELGITHLSQLGGRLEDVKDILDEDDIRKAKTIIDNPEYQGLDFRMTPLNKVTTTTDKPQEVPAKVDPVKPPQPDPTANISSTVPTLREKGAQGFIFPDQSKLPPSALQLPTLNVTRRQRIDRVKIGIEYNLTEIFKQQNFVAQQIDNVPDSQRASALSNLLAGTQEQANKAITSVNSINAQNQQAAELFNIRQADAEDQARGINLRQYEALAQTAVAKTEKDMRDFFDYNQRVAINNLKSQQRLNLISATAPDFELDVFGNAVNFDPSFDFQLNKKQI